MRRGHGAVRAVGHPGLVRACLTAALGCLLLGGCAEKVDPSRPFEMAMNGARYEPRLLQPIGYVQEIEAGFSTECRCSVLFPSRVPSAIPRPGLEIAFDPRKIAPGEEVAFGSGDEESGVTVDYSPIGGHKLNQGIMLGFSSGHSGGRGRIRFDDLEPEIGGHVRGTLLHATLYGSYENAESGETTEPKTPRKLELWNFPFDVKLAASPF
jgi:hypothetical protein